MNTRAHDLVNILHGILDGVPGATGLSFHRATAWTYLLIAASTDATVRVLSHDLGLGAPELRIAERISWLRAMSESGRGELRVEVVGPHRGAPPARR